MPLPLPVPNEETRPFWDWCARQELRAQRCSVCQSWQHPPQPFCSNCGSGELTWERLRGGGAVFSFIVTHQPVHPALEGLIPHAVVLVELEEGIRITSNLVDYDPANIEIGMAVEVVFEKINDEITLPKFRVV